MKRKNEGITLVALVITIIVLIILAGVTLSMVVGDNGIITKAKEAKQNMSNATAEEKELLQNMLNEMNEIENDNIINKGVTIKELVENGTIKIGDYVSYIPAESDSYIIDGEISGVSQFIEESGKTDLNPEQKINRENLNWRVLDIKDNKVRLISENETEKGVMFYGANGYNNAVYILDDLCSKLYKGNKSTAKNIKIEDIQEKMNLSYWDYHNDESLGGKYGNSYDISEVYPLIAEQEKNCIINGKSGTLGQSEQNDIVRGGWKKTDKYTVKPNLWFGKLSEKNYKNPIYNELFGAIKYQNYGLPGYWLSSRCLGVNTSMDEPRALFNVFFMTLNDGCYMYSGGMEGNYYNSIRPIISLDSDVEIDMILGNDGSSAEKAWKIKKY